MSKASYKISIFAKNVSLIAYSGSLDPMIVLKAVEDSLSRKCVHIVIDLTNVTYAPSAAVGAFIGLKNSIEKKDGLIVFAAPPHNIQIVLDMMGFREMFTFFENAETALKTLIANQM